MKNKKLSHNGLQGSVTSVMAALLCILIGLFVGFLVLLAINPAHAWADGFVRILKGGFHDAPYGVGKELANAAPLIMTGLSVGFAFKTGLFNIGAAGQYTLGAYGALYCAIMLKLPWFVCLLAAAILGGLWGAIPGFFKAYFNINEVITSIMFNWIGLYLVNELIYQNGTGPMYDVRNTRTINISKNADYAQSIIPDFGLNKLFQTNSTTIAIFLAAVVAILIWVVLNKTTFGYELKAVGLNKSAARYAGINEKKNIILSMAIAGALAGFGAGLFYLSNVFNYYLRNDGSQRRAGAGSVIGNLCDIALNITLVLALDMGTRGAALSTALGQIITIAIYLPGFFGQKHTLRFALPRGRWLVPALSALKAGMATSVQYLYQMIFFLVCNNLLIRLGGETAVAVFDVIQNTSYLILYLFEGTGRAMQPILSTYQGEHNRQGMRNTVRLGFTAGLTVGGALIALVELWPAGMCLLFGIAGSASEALACTALRLYGAGALFAGINILLCNYYQACENEKPSFLLETLRGAVLLIPLTFICYVLGLQRFWLLFLLTEAGSLAVFLLLGLGGRYKKAELPEERIFQRTILSNAEDVMDVCRELEAFCEVWGADMKQQMFSTMTVEELGMAILKHGFQGRTDGYLQLTAIMDESGVLELHLRDDATTFNPFALDTSRASRDEAFDMDGMGVLVIKKRAKEFFYRRYQGFNTLIIKI